MHSVNERWSERSLDRMSVDGHSGLTERTHLSVKAIRIRAARRKAKSPDSLGRQHIVDRRTETSYLGQAGGTFEGGTSLCRTSAYVLTFVVVFLCLGAT